jgi:two-component system, OmpR family, response regulator BaeR
MTGSRTVFIVEDDPKIALLLSDYLSNSDFKTRIFGDGRDVVAEVKLNSPDAIILDLMLPASDGMTICKAIREFSAVPILMLTARVEESDILAGLDCGADDYVIKPFSPKQVVARITALVRRSEGRVTNDISARRFWVNEHQQTTFWRGNVLPLSTSEYQILAAMMKQPGRIFSRDQLLDRLGERAEGSGDRAIDSHIKNIRRKIGAIDPETRCVASVYGSGYRFDPGTDK